MRTASAGTVADMHNDDIERPTPAPDAEDIDREAVVAADDTGLISQQGLLTNIAIGDAESAGTE